VLEANDEFLRMASYNRDDILSGRITWTDLMAPDLHDRNDATVGQQENRNDFEPFEKEYTRNDGSRVPVLIGATTFEDGSNEGVAFVLDLTNLKRAEENYRQSELKPRQIIETVPGFIWSTDPAGEPTHFNQRLLDYSGKRLEDFQHRGWKSFVHPADLPTTAKALDQAIQAGTSFDSVHRLRRADGEYRWHHARAEPMRDREGRIVQWYGLSVDIDEEKRAEGALRDSEYKLHQIVDAVPGHIWSWDSTCKPNHVNQQLVDFFGGPYELSELDNHAACVHPDDFAEHERARSHSIQTGTSFKFMSRLRRADGVYRWHEGHCKPLRDEHGGIVQWYGLSFDVDDRKNAEDLLRRSE